VSIGSHQSAARLTDDWITPREILTALGNFDLDPCACIPQPWPTAKRMLTIKDDGLAAEWPKTDRVWLNPPYGQEIGKWLGKLAEHGQGTALVFARTETAAFFNAVWGKATAILFLKGRLQFHRPDGTRAKANAGAPSVLIAYGHVDAEILRSCGPAGQFVYLNIKEPRA